MNLSRSTWRSNFQTYPGEHHHRRLCRSPGVSHSVRGNNGFGSIGVRATVQPAETYGSFDDDPLSDDAQTDASGTDTEDSAMRIVPEACLVQPLRAKP